MLYLYELSSESPGESSPNMKGMYNDGHHDGHHCSIDHVPSCMVTALLPQKQSNVNPRTRDSNGNCAGARGLRGCPPADTALGSLGGGVFISYNTVNYVLTGTYKRT